MRGWKLMAAWSMIRPFIRSVCMFSARFSRLLKKYAAESTILLRLRDVLAGNSSDATLARAVYDRWGAEGLVHLIGVWSLAICDQTEQAVVLASDFAGVRPLYYCVQRNRVLWSTRLGPLVDL